MSRGRLWASLVAIVVAAVVALVVNLSLGNTPVLGLDLRGGVSVILQPTEAASTEDLTVVRDLIRDELEDRGIAEPDVRVEGSNVVVDLPGVRDQQEALEAVDIAGIVTLRPVVRCGLADPATTPAGPVESDTTSSTVPPSSSSTPDDADAPEDTTVDDATTSTSSAVQGFRAAAPRQDEPVDPATDEGTPVDGSSTTAPAGTSAPDDTVSDTDSTGTGTTAPDAADDGDTETTIDPQELQELLDDAVPQSTPIGQAGEEVLPVRDTGEACLVGASPPGATGEVFARGSASAAIDPNTGGWIVTTDLRGDGEVVWNSLANQCFNRTASCPSGQLAIVLDGVIQSAPSVNAPSFSGGVTISGGFTEGEVRDLARVLNRGAFPVDVEAQSVQTVSPTLGNDSLRAAVIAGLIGVALILLFMIAYYRRLSIVIIGGLIVWGLTVFSAAAFVSQATNYSLSLAGATGIIVAVGVTVDSYVVFFERLKDEVRNGRTLRNASPRSFDATWRTIVSADLVSIMASTILFWLSVGTVKGFALYLGLTAICDLLVCFFFTRPAVHLLTRTRWLRDGSAIGMKAVTS